MVSARNPEFEQVFIKEAVIITPGCVRLRLVRWRAHKGGAPGKWYEWKSSVGVKAYQEAGLLRAHTVIPARVILGSDFVKEVEIYWNRRWKGRERLLASWVMCS